MEIVRIAAKRYLLHLFVLVLFCATAAWSQETTGTLLGTVTDATGATISNAKVTITNTEKNQVLRTLNTNQSGAFNAPNLAVGTYTVQIEAPGFKTQSYKNIVLNVNDERALKAQLQPGGVSESVQVQADALEVETQNATAQGLISGTQIRELSLKSRNYEELVALMPGVTSDISDTLYVGVSAPSGGTNEVGFSINGSLESQNNWTVDGADNVDRGGNFTLLNYPSVDAISEFKVLRGNYNPEYGRGAGGQINLITRSGTSQFHGSAYEFFRNDALDANTWLNKRTDPIVPKNQLRYNDFGWTLGGPVFIPKVYNTEKNKTFFFYSEELRRVREEQSALSFVPNAAERGFSTNGIPTFADAVCVDYPNCNVISNTIPTSAINPAAAAYLKDVYSKIPLPQDPINHSLVAPGTNTFNYRQEIIRLDHYQNEKWNFMFRYMNDNIPTIETGGLFNGNSIPNITQTNTNSPGRNYIGKVTYLPSPTLINEIAYAYSYGAVTSDNTGVLPFSASPDVASAIALPFPNQLQRIPNISFANGTGFAGFGNYRDFNRNHNVFDNLTKVAGNHTLKFGFSYNAYQKSENAAGNNVGSFSFSQGTSFVPCCDTDPNNAGNPSAAQNFEQEWANFLTGNADNFSQLGSDFHAEIRQKQFEFYGQDTYRFRPNLTFNYGLRYSLFL
ncbi:MAG TPA: carboxypeptidase regulatory-like domain-containing protein, partial [Terriglobales bacterium]